MYALGGVYSGTAHGVAKLVASFVMISYCSMALYSGLTIMNGLKDLAARNTVAAKAKRTIFHYIIAAFACVLLTCVYNGVTAVFRFGRIIVESPPCSSWNPYMQVRREWAMSMGTCVWGHECVHESVQERIFAHFKRMCTSK